MEKFATSTALGGKCGLGRPPLRGGTRRCSVGVLRTLLLALLVSTASAVWTSQRSTSAGSSGYATSLVASSSGARPANVWMPRAEREQLEAAASRNSTVWRPSLNRGAPSAASTNGLAPSTSRSRKPATAAGARHGLSALQKKRLADKELRSRRRKAEVADEEGEPSAILQRRRLRTAAMRKKYSAIAAGFLDRHSLAKPPHQSFPPIDKALNQELVDMWLDGDDAAAMRMRYYPVRWFWVMRDTDLPLSSASRKGYGNTTRENVRDPHAWEQVLLAARGALEAALPTGVERSELASATLLATDTYGRNTEILRSRTAELLGAVAQQKGVAGRWSLTMHPSTGDEVSKTGQQDDTVQIGTLNESRLWLSSIAAALKGARRTHEFLFDLTPSQFRKGLAAACAHAGVPRMVPHELRHTGPSADAIAGVSEQALQRQGRWKSVQNVARYTKPGRYLRALAGMTPAQLAAAREAEKYLKAHLPALIADAARQRRRRNDR